MNRLKESNVFSGGGVIPLNNRRTLLKSYIWNYVVSNSGKATLENSIKGDIDLELIGGTEQFTTTGKNLLNIPFIDGSVRETPIQCNFEKPTLIHAETLPKSIQSNAWRIKVVYKDNTLKYVVDSDMQKGSLFDASPENPIVSINYRGLYITEGQYEKIQVEHGVKVTPYEPYTGGKPSPSPEYQQEIKNVGKWNKATGKYEIDIILNGSNLWKEDSMIRGHLTANGEIVYKEDDSNCIWTVVVPRDGKYAVRIEKESVGGLYFTRIFSDKVSEPYVRLNPGQKGVLTLKKGENKIQASSISALRPIGNEKVMLSYGDQEPPTYEPYQEPQALTLTSDRPVTKWDKLVEQDGQIGWLYKHRIVNDLSALVKDSEPIYGKDGEKYFSVSLQGALFNYDYNKIYSVAGLCPKDSKIHYVPKPMIQSVVIYVSDTDTIMTAKEHMHYKVVYETTESQFAPLSESEQTQLRNLHSYNGTTHINIDSGEVPCGIKLTYKQKK